MKRSRLTLPIVADFQGKMLGRVSRATARAVLFTLKSCIGEAMGPD